MKTFHSPRLAYATLLAAFLAASLTVRAEIKKQTVADIYKKLTSATGILQFYFETDDGQRVERDAIVTLVGEDGLAMTSIDYFPVTTRIEDFKDITLTIGSGDDKKEFPAEILGRDEEAKVAFVRAKSDKPLHLSFIQFQAADVSVGDEILVSTVVEKAVGYTRAFNEGCVNAILEKPTRMYCVTSDARGISGAPVFDAAGRAIGIFTIYNTTRRGQQQVNMGGRIVLREGMIPVQIPVVQPAERFLAAIKNPPQSGERAKRAWVGVTALQAFTADLAKFFGQPKGGVVIGQVVKGSPADKGGLKTEDILLSYGSLELKQDEDKVLEVLSQTIRGSEIGKPLDLVVWRPSTKTKLTVKVTPEQSPKSAAEARRYTNRTFGFTTREVVVEDMLALRRSELTGAFVSFVHGSSWSGQAQLQNGDIVQKINDTPVTTLGEFQDTFEKIAKPHPKDIFLQVLRGGKETAIIHIEPRWETMEKE